jgi:hypothetical protein
MIKLSQSAKDWARRCIPAGITALMLILSSLTVSAQTMMPLPAHSSSYTGYSRGFWFTAPTSFHIVGVRAPTDASSTTPQSVFLVRFTSTPLTSATTTPNYVVLGSWYQVPGTAMIPTGNILINAGDMIGIIGHRCTIPATNFNAINSYGSGPATSNIFGMTVTLTRLLYQNNIDNLVPGPGTLWQSTGQIGRVEIYYAPPCQFPENISTMKFSDAGGNPIGYAEIPSTIFAEYTLNYPTEETNYTATITFTKVGAASPTIPTSKYVVTLNDHKNAGADLNGTQSISLPSTLEPGYYTISTAITSKNSCLNYDNFKLPDQTLMLVYPGTSPCVVWPGDVNNDGLVNYGDRKSLNSYIYDAELRATWLAGPARFMVNPQPLSFLAWTPQAAVPWSTNEGCYMDADGNGTVNNFDYVAIKMNWMHTHSVVKNTPVSSSLTFDMTQNFPNPFNPATKIGYSVPEQSNVRLTVIDMMGRTVATLVDQTVEAGSHEASFDANGMPSGQYMATVTMTGIESGLTFSKTIKMTLMK